MLGGKNSSQIDEFFTTGSHEGLNVYYKSQRFLPYPDKVLEIIVID